MKRTFTALLVAAIIPASSAVLAQPQIVPVRVTSAPRGKMASRLASAVFKEVRSDKRFALVEDRSAEVLEISLPDDVGWQRRLDWTEIHYQARLNYPSGHSNVIAGHCWNWNLRACAQQIIDAAASTAPPATLR